MAKAQPNLVKKVGTVTQNLLKHISENLEWNVRQIIIGHGSFLEFLRLIWYFESEEHSDRIPLMGQWCKEFQNSDQISLTEQGLNKGELQIFTKDWEKS